MMKWIFSGMILLSVVTGVMNGRMAEVSQAAMGGAGEAVELVLSLLGMMCLWNGVMRVAREAQLTDRLSRLLSPVLRVLFRGFDLSLASSRAIAMNLTANLLGLGSAATPLGLTAMREMEREAGYPQTATDKMILFVVLNTASMQILPTTTAMLRMNAGSAAPFEILPAVWISSAASVLSGIVMAKLLGQRKGRMHRWQPSRTVSSRAS